MFHNFEITKLGAVPNGSQSGDYIYMHVLSDCNILHFPKRHHEEQTTKLFILDSHINLNEMILSLYA